MSHTYTKHDTKKLRKVIRFSGLLLSLVSFLCLVYIAFPLVSWKFYFEPVFASGTLQTPIPRATVLSESNLQTLIITAVDSLNLDYSDAKNWFPQYQSAYEKAPPAPAVITTFNISIPKLKIKYANVSTVDTDLSQHLVLYPGTAIPPNKGNTVIFGHSTIPSWFNPVDYKTIFATAHTLKKGDEIISTVNTKEYIYRIISITITTPQDTSVFAQDNNAEYLTLITCTPPGTTWKRLIIKAKLERPK